MPVSFSKVTVIRYDKASDFFVVVEFKLQFVKVNNIFVNIISSLVSPRTTMKKAELWI